MYSSTNHLFLMMMLLSRKRRKFRILCSNGSKIKLSNLAARIYLIKPIFTENHAKASSKNANKFAISKHKLINHMKLDKVGQLGCQKVKTRIKEM